MDQPQTATSELLTEEWFKQVSDLLDSIDAQEHGSQVRNVNSSGIYLLLYILPFLKFWKTIFEFGFTISNIISSNQTEQWTRHLKLYNKQQKPQRFRQIPQTKPSQNDEPRRTRSPSRRGGVRRRRCRNRKRQRRCRGNGRPADPSSNRTPPRKWKTKPQAAARSWQFRRSRIR